MTTTPADTPEGVKHYSWFGSVLKEAGFQVTDDAFRLVCSDEFGASIFHQPIEVDLYIATVKGLTGKDRAEIEDVHLAIRKKGYQLCPPEVGPRLRSQFPDQESMRRVYIAMTLIYNRSFVVGNWTKCFLDAFTHSMDGLKGEERVVFIKPRK
jgi:hypothetical protein